MISNDKFLLHCYRIRLQNCKMSCLPNNQGIISRGCIQNDLHRLPIFQLLGSISKECSNGQERHHQLWLVPFHMVQADTIACVSLVAFPSSTLHFHQLTSFRWSFQDGNMLSECLWNQNSIEKTIIVNCNTATHQHIQTCPIPFRNSWKTSFKSQISTFVIEKSGRWLSQLKQHASQTMIL